MKVFLTGSKGMVGSNILERAREEGLDVLAPSRKELDLLDGLAVQRYLDEHQPDLIIHAAGKVGGIQANIRQPVDFLVDNLSIGLNVINGARLCGIKKVLNLGSSCMYPKDAPSPLREELMLRGELEPTNEGYALAKITMERLCEYTNRQYPEFRFKTLIPCNLYGKWDKFEPNNSHMIPAVIDKLHRAKISGRSSVEIWGDGTARREFMYTGDLADCIMKAMADFESLPDSMNVGLGYDYSIREYYEIAAEVVGYKGDFTYDFNKPTGMKQKLVDVSLQQRWGWSPSTSLKAGLQMTYSYYLNAEAN